jgi:hypothetical protein
MIFLFNIFARISRRLQHRRLDICDSAAPCKMDARCNGNRAMRGGGPSLKFSHRAVDKRGIAIIALIAMCYSSDSALAQKDADLSALGIRKISGKHIDVFTDIRNNPSVDELPVVFDAAVPQLEKYFALPAGTLERWRVRASIMQKENVETFSRGGLLPPSLPPFLHGYARKRDLWVFEQPSDYYRRHLLLHEGVHALMAEFLHGMGPPWYAEGMAELLATHQWKNKKLTLKYFPVSRDEVPEWGRVKVLREAVTAKQIPTLDEIFDYGHTAHLVVPPYAWSWAATTFFESHPKHGKAFAELQNKTELGDDQFNAQFRAALKEDGPRLAHEWHAFVSEADYGCLVDRTYVTSVPLKQLTGQPVSSTLRADRGWQSAGVKFEANKTYKIKIDGRYVIRQTPQKWECEPQGVTVHYHRQNPLGMVLGALIDESTAPEMVSPLVTGAPLSLGREFKAKNAGVLYLRVNELASGLGDNEGQFTVTVREIR